MARRWYVFQTHPSLEHLASKHLLRQNYEIFIPWVKVERKRKGVVIRVEDRALFPSYGFVFFDKVLDRWRPICSTYGVKRLFGSAPDNPIAVPPGVVENLQAESCAVPSQITVTQYEALPVDCVVQIDSGPYAGHTGVCQWSDEQRVAMLLQILGGQVSVIFKRSSVHQVEIENGTATAENRGTANG